MRTGGGGAPRKPRPLEARPLTAVPGGLVTEDAVGRSGGVGPDQVHLGLLASATEDVLTLQPWRTHRPSRQRGTWLAAGGAAALTRHHRDGTPGPARLLAVLLLGLDGFLQLLDLLPNLVQDPLRPEDIRGTLAGHAVSGLLARGPSGSGLLPAGCGCWRGRRSPRSP